MRRIQPILASTLLTFLGFCGSANAAVLTFDDLAPCTGLCGSLGAYGGLNWSDSFHYMHTPSYNPTDSDDGYNNGTVSGEYVAYNHYAAAVSVSDTLFDFNGAYLTSAWRTGLNIEVKGFMLGIELYSSTIVTDYNPAMWFDFNFIGIDEVTFTSSGGTEVAGLNGSGAHFAMDNFTFNETTVPEPATLTLMGLGLAGLGYRRKKQA